jgi:hypothetical protein
VIDLDPKRQATVRETRDDYMRRVEYHEDQARALRAVAESLTHRWQLPAYVTELTQDEEQT